MTEREVGCGRGFWGLNRRELVVVSSSLCRLLLTKAPFERNVGYEHQRVLNQGTSTLRRTSVSGWIVCVFLFFSSKFLCLLTFSLSSWFAIFYINARPLQTQFVSGPILLFHGLLSNTSAALLLATLRTEYSNTMMGNGEAWARWWTYSISSGQFYWAERFTFWINR